LSVAKDFEELDELTAAVLECMKRFPNDVEKRKRCENEASERIIGVKLWQTEGEQEQQRSGGLLSKLKRFFSR